GKDGDVQPLLPDGADPGDRHSYLAESVWTGPRVQLPRGRLGGAVHGGRARVGRMPPGERPLAFPRVSRAPASGADVVRLRRRAGIPVEAERDLCGRGHLRAETVGAPAAHRPLTLVLLHAAVHG